MKFFKHIFVVLALIALMLPCGHAADHDAHAHEAETAEQICAASACACHGCDEAPCTAAPELPQERTPAPPSVSVSPRPPSFLAFSDSKPLERPALFTTGGILASIQTVQLLI